MDELTGRFLGADGPRPLPDSLRVRLEAVLLGGDVVADMHGIDRPRPLPPALRTRLTRTVTRRRVAAWQVATAAAAAAAVLAGLIVVPNATRTRPRPGAVATQPPTPVAPSPRVPALPPTATQPGGPVSAPAIQIPPPPIGRRGTSPPFFGVASIQLPAMPAYGAGGGTGSDAPRSRPPVPAYVSVTGSDPDVRAGFNAYLALVGQQRDVGNRTIEIARAPSQALVTVNLGQTPLSGSSNIPVLETLDVEASRLTGDVFGISSTSRRQARVLADQLLARTDVDSPGGTAVIYRRGGGGFAGVVPSEIRAILEAAGVLVLTVDHEPGGTLVPADIAIVSMPPVQARAFVAEARNRDYRPRLGLAGIWSMHDDGVRAELGTDATVISPYWASGDERDAFEKGVRARGGRVGAAALHGWATAKAIAVALWERDPRTPSEMAAALTLDADLRVCPYGRRADTNERTPDGLLLEGTSAGYTPRTAWLKDARP